MDSAEQELAAFRQRWLEEVKRKQPASAAPAPVKTAQASSSKAPKSKGPDVPSHARHHSEEIDEATPHVYRDLGDKQHGRRLDESSAQAAAAVAGSAEPQSALEHYERAVEKETQGSLGDSLNLYRKAFKVRLPKYPRITSKCSLSIARQRRP